VNERIVRFGPGGRSVGIVAGPSGESSTGVVFLNAGLLHRVGNGRLSVRIARSLAAVGVPSYRFDFSGMGDSERRDDNVSGLAASHDETREAVARFQDVAGVQRVILFGLCRGADVAVRAAPELPAVTGLILIDPWVYPTSQFYLRRYAPRLLVPQVWLRAPATLTRAMRSQADAEHAPPIRPFPPKDEVAGLLGAFTARDGRILAWFTGGYAESYFHEGQFRAAFDAVDFGDRLSERYLPAADHIVSGPREQDTLVAGTIESILTWRDAADKR
jgi:alpha/beta superfamily hydrolase